VVREAATLIGPIASGRNVAVILDPSIEEASPLTGDRQRLLQVLLNLLSNAVKYNRNGGSAVISARAADGYVSIDVADTGRGIPIDQLSRLFLPFDRLGVEATGIEGVGLGLSLSKALVEAMSGIVEVESRPGEGATFRVKLPVAAEQPDRLERHPPATHDEENLAASGCVLYIEDNASNLKLVARLLERRPRVRLLTALLGGLGLELAREHEPDLILLDGHLPDMDGAMVLRRLRADSRTAKIPVVILSADATAGQVERLLAAGAADYMTKPLDVPRVLQVIDAFLRGDRRSEMSA
jgi:CheY-like chemotaxis protein/anti-sigma regulatory factor (Ser/Thr protein kinase)